MLLFSDLHLSDKTADIVFNEVFPGLEHAAISHSVNTVYFLGDFWHDKFQVSTYCLSRLSFVLNRWNKLGIKLVLMPGNHDMSRVAGNSGIDILEGYESVTVVREPGLVEGAYWIPYCSRSLLNEYIYQAIEETKKTTPIFIHAGIEGAYLNAVRKDTDGISVESLKGRVVIAGHYHRYQKVAPGVFYVGSPYQVDAGEAGQDKGYCILKGKKLTLHPQDWGYKHRTVVIKDVKDLESFPAGEKDIINFSFQGVDPALATEYLSDLAVADYKVTSQKPELEKSRLDVAEGADLTAYAEAYAAHTQPDKEADLMKIFKMVIE